MAGLALHRCRGRPRRCVPRLGGEAPPGRKPPACDAPLPLLARLPRPALRRGGPRPGVLLGHARSGPPAQEHAARLGPLRARDAPLRRHVRRGADLHSAFALSAKALHKPRQLVTRLPHLRDAYVSATAEIGEAMRHLRFAAIALALFAVAGTAFAGSASHSPNAPKNLHGFLLRSNEPTTNEFPRTPAFAWSPVNGALCYEFELGTSKSFTQNTLIWSNVSYGVGAKPACRT